MSNPQGRGNPRTGAPPNNGQRAPGPRPGGPGPVGTPGRGSGAPRPGGPSGPQMQTPGRGGPSRPSAPMAPGGSPAMAPQGRGMARGQPQQGQPQGPPGQRVGVAGQQGPPTMAPRPSGPPVPSGAVRVPPPVIGGRGGPSSAPTPQPGPAPPGRGQTGISQPMAQMSLASTSSAPTTDPNRSQPTGTSQSGGSGGRGSGGRGSGSGDAAHALTLQAPGPGVGRGRGVPRESSAIVQTRPAHLTSKKGKGGQTIEVYSNYFSIKKSDDWHLLQYRVDFQPPEDDTKFKKQMLRQLDDKIGNYIFDGTMLFTVTRFPKDPMMFTVKSEQGQVHQVSLRLVGEVQSGDWNYIQLFNILLRKMFDHLKLTQLGRNYYDPGAKVDAKQYKLEIWPGYVTSIRHHEKDMLMCVDQGFKIMRTDSALEQMRSIMKNSKGEFKAAIQKYLLGQIVITRYNNKTYKIDDIAFNRNPSETFEHRGRTISIAQYLKERYGLNTTDMKQPLLISNPNAKQRRAGLNNPIPLVPEHAFMTGLSDEQRADFRLMTEVAKTTRTAPPNRIQALQRFSKRITEEPKIKEELGKWNLEFGNVQKFEGRTLPPETLISGPKHKETTYGLENAEWNSMFRGYQLFGPVNCNKWAIVYCSKDKDCIGEFQQMLQKSANGMGFRMTAPKPFEVADYRGQTYTNKMNEVLQMKPDMMMVVIPNNKSDLYSVTKKLCCVTTPCPTQVMTAALLKKGKGLGSIATKVAIQMAAKLGAEPWIVKLPQIDGLMVIGYDTWHNSSQKGQSVGGFVSTTNQSLTRFFSQCTLHNNNEEMCDNMKACVAQAVRIYIKNNGVPPKRIVFYRDGVGEGQIEQVRSQEVSLIQEFLDKNIFGCKFTFLIITKRINTRFYKINPDRTIVNPPSGSIFDDVVTLPERYDFFIVSQSVRQGTVNPTSYNVIQDNSGWAPFQIQGLTYKMAHLYYNWPGVVKVPHVCQLAHKLAYLVGESIHQRPRQMEELLYYL